MNESVIVIKSMERKDFPPNGDKPASKVWNIVDEEGQRYACWADSLFKFLAVGNTVKVKYTEKQNGQYTNRNITAVASYDADTDSFGEWVEDARPKQGGGFGGKGGGWKPDPARDANIMRQSALNAAVALVSAAIPRAPKMHGLDVWANEVTKVAEIFRGHLGVGDKVLVLPVKVNSTKAPPAPKPAARPAPKPVIEAEVVEEPQEEEVPF